MSTARVLHSSSYVVIYPKHSIGCACHTCIGPLLSCREGIPERAMDNRLTFIVVYTRIGNSVNTGQNTRREDAGVGDELSCLLPLNHGENDKLANDPLDALQIYPKHVLYYPPPPPPPPIIFVFLILPPSLLSS